jgi:hypothetical protein
MSLHSVSAISAAAVLLAACSEVPSSPRIGARDAASLTVSGGSNVLPSGERLFGQVSVEPAYNDVTGSIIYLITPDRAPFPSKANTQHATAPLYLVEYPAGSNMGTLNCMGIPGNCPDHDLEVATAATQIMPNVYGNDPTVLPGHDHLVAAPASGGDFNVAWEVVEVLFTNKAAVKHLTTEQEIDDAVKKGDAITVDLGFAFNCSVVPAATYWKGTPAG